MNPPESNIVREGVVAVIERDGRFLAIVRSATVIAPGKICFPGGGIETGETMEQALIRECYEELGVTVLPLREIDVSVTPWNVRLSWWTAFLAEPFEPRPNPREVAKVLWLTFDEMLKHPDLLESNIPFLQKWKKEFPQSETAG